MKTFYYRLSRIRLLFCIAGAIISVKRELWELLARGTRANGVKFRNIFPARAPCPVVTIRPLSSQVCYDLIWLYVTMFFHCSLLPGPLLVPVLSAVFPRYIPVRVVRESETERHERSSATVESSVKRLVPGK